MNIRLNLLIKLNNKEEKERIESRTSEYIYIRNNMLHYSGFSNRYNYVGFCSYSKDDTWIIYGDLVKIDKFDSELEKFKYYLDYIEVDSKGIKLIIEGENDFSIKTIQNLMNIYFNYESVIRKVFNLDNRYLVNETEVDNLNELIEMTDELPEDVIELAIEDKEEHKNNSPIDLSEYPCLVFKDLNLKFELMKDYFQFVIELVKKCNKRISIKKSRNDYIRNEKYQMRSLLRNLGFNGNKFKDLRKVFLKNLSGNVAFRSA